MKIDSCKNLLYFPLNTLTSKKASLLEKTVTLVAIAVFTLLSVGLYGFIIGQFCLKTRKVSNVNLQQSAKFDAALDKKDYKSAQAVLLTYPSVKEFYLKKQQQLDKRISAKDYEGVKKMLEDTPQLANMPEIEMLAEHGRNFPHIAGNLSIQFARNQDFKMLKLLLTLGVTPNPNAGRKSLLKVVVDAHHAEALEYLLANYDDIFQEQLEDMLQGYFINMNPQYAIFSCLFKHIKELKSQGISGLNHFSYLGMVATNYKKDPKNYGILLKELIDKGLRLTKDDSGLPIPEDARGLIYFEVKNLETPSFYESIPFIITTDDI